MAEPAWWTVAPQLWPSMSMAPGGQVSLAFRDEQGCAGRWEPGPGSAEQGGRGAGCVCVCVCPEASALPGLLAAPARGLPFPFPVASRFGRNWGSLLPTEPPAPSFRSPRLSLASFRLPRPGAQGLGRSAPQPSRHPGLLTGLRGLVCTGVRTPSPLLNPRGRRNMVRWVLCGWGGVETASQGSPGWRRPHSPCNEQDLPLAGNGVWALLWPSRASPPGEGDGTHLGPKRTCWGWPQACVAVGARDPWTGLG